MLDHDRVKVARELVEVLCRLFCMHALLAGAHACC
jgi:hypothetical protein